MPLTDFYVQPASMLAGLGAVSQGIEAMIQKEERQKKQAISSGLINVMRSQDPDLVFDFISENPEAINIADKMAGFVSDITKQDKVATAKRILFENQFPAEAMADHAETIEREGGDPTQTIETARRSAADPEYGIRQAEMMLALYDPDAWKQYREATMQAPEELTAKQKEFESLTVELSPKEKLKAKRISLGLDPRAMGSAVQTITKEGIVTEIAQTEATIAGMKEGAKLAKQLKLRPEIESAVTRAVSIANEIAADRKTAKSDVKAFDLYNASMRGLISGISGTDTGPFVGWIPAITEKAQIAEGAIAAMAPVMKQLFRAAGEGTFTKDDQEVLMAMLPTRKDKPTVVISKLQNVDTIVKMKLGQAPSELPEGVSEMDIQTTMQANNMTREQVLARLRGQ